MKASWGKVVFAAVSVSAVISAMIPTTASEAFAGTQQSTTITVWVHPFLSDTNQQNHLFNLLIQGFEKKNPNIQVNLQTLPWTDWDQKNVTALSAPNGGPDVLYLIPDMITQYASNGMLAPLNTLLPKKDFSQFTSGSMEGVTYNKKAYGLPILQSCVGWVYNLDVLKKAGVSAKQLPVTWTQFESLLKKVKGVAENPFIYNGSNTPNVSFYPYLWQAGGNVFDSKGKTIVNNSAGLAAMNFIYNIKQQGLMNRDAAAPANGGAAFLSTGAVFMTDSSSWSQLAPTVNFKWKLGPVLKDKTQATYATVGAFAINQKSQQKAAAAKFVEYITGEQADLQFLTATNYIPPRKDLIQMWSDNPFMAEMTLDAQKFGHPGVVNPLSRNVAPVVSAEVQAILTGQATPKSALDSIANQIANIRKQAGQ